MKHLIQQYSHFYGEKIHLEENFPHFPCSVHQFDLLDKTYFLRIYRLFMKTNRIIISVGFFLRMHHLKNQQ